MFLDDLRKEIDKIDLDMLKLFKERMEVSRKIGFIKKEMNLKIFDQSREREVLQKRKEWLNDDELWPYYKRFLEKLFMLSKEYQSE